jgi:hypothetical protein
MKAQDIGQNCACHYGRIYRFIRHQPAKRREGQTRDR